MLDEHLILSHLDIWLLGQHVSILVFFIIWFHNFHSGAFRRHVSFILVPSSIGHRFSSFVGAMKY